MPLGIIVLLLGFVGFVVDFIEKENKRQKRQQKTFPKQKKQAKHTELINPVTKKAINTAFWGAFNTVFDTPSQKLEPTVKPKVDNSTVIPEMSFAEDEFYEDDFHENEFYEDEENFETELTTPMSMAIDEEPLYSDSEWETLTQEKKDVKAVSLVKSKAVKKRGSLQKAYVYSEVFGKPKGLE